jgi:hypothetical protein
MNLVIALVRLLVQAHLPLLSEVDFGERGSNPLSNNFLTSASELLSL